MCKLLKMNPQQHDTMSLWCFVFSIFSSQVLSEWIYVSKRPHEQAQRQQCEHQNFLLCSTATCRRESLWSEPSLVLPLTSSHWTEPWLLSTYKGDNYRTNIRIYATYSLQEESWPDFCLKLSPKSRGNKVCRPSSSCNWKILDVLHILKTIKIIMSSPCCRYLPSPGLFCLGECLRWWSPPRRYLCSCSHPHNPQTPKTQ